MINQRYGFLYYKFENSSSQSWQLPTFPLKRVSSVLQGLTSLFGMGRGVTPATNHQDSELEYS